MIDIKDRLNKRKAIYHYLKLMNLVKFSIRDVEDDPVPHIARLNQEVHRLRTYIGRIERAVYPPVDCVAGRSQYPESIDITAQMSRRLQNVEFILACYNTTGEDTTGKEGEKDEKDG